jgi:hypothetical protein
MERIRRHIGYANVMATIAVLLAMSGGAVAATGGFSSGGTLKACANEEGVIRLLKAGKSCKKGQKTVAWNIAGPAGAKGATGASGATGATGAAGPKGTEGPKGAAGSKGAEGTEGEGGESLIYWAKFSFEGNAIAGYGVNPHANFNTDGFRFEVEFNENIENCAITATPNVNIHATISAEPAGNKVYVYIKEDQASDKVAFSIVANCI